MENLKIPIRFVILVLLIFDRAYFQNQKSDQETNIQKTDVVVIFGIKALKKNAMVGNHETLQVALLVVK